MHDPTLPTVISSFRHAAARGPVPVVRHPVEREPATGVRCDTAALRSLLAGLDPAVVRIALVPDAMTDEAVEAWIEAAVIRPPDHAVVTAGPVTDAVKAVDAGGRILGTVDRADLRWARSPALLPVAPLRVALEVVVTVTVDPVPALAAQGVPITSATG